MQILMSTYLSIHHAKSAAHFARLAARVENSDCISSTSEIGIYVGASILSSVAFLEATINELFAEAENDPNKWLENISDESKRLIKTLSALEAIERSSIIDKYEIFLVSAGFEPVLRGSTESQNAKALIVLRNSITHYKAAWLDSGSKELMRNGSSYKGDYWVNLNKLVFGKDHNCKPHKWEQKEYARWACESAFAFVEAIFGRIGSKSNIEHIKDDLSLS